MTSLNLEDKIRRSLSGYQDVMVRVREKEDYRSVNLAARDRRRYLRITLKESDGDSGLRGVFMGSRSRVERVAEALRKDKRCKVTGVYTRRGDRSYGSSVEFVCMGVKASSLPRFVKKVGG